MQENDRLELISLVEARINQLNREFRDHSLKTERAHEQDDDPAAKLDATINSPVSGHVMAEHQEEFRQLQNNLKWLNSDVAGCCEECGCDIPLARLKAMLDTRLCVECAANTT